MPTTRKRRSRNAVIELDDAVRLHLETGDCCLAGPGLGCGCGLRGPDGAEREDLVSMFKKRMAARDSEEVPA